MESKKEDAALIEQIDALTKAQIERWIERYEADVTKAARYPRIVDTEDPVLTGSKERLAMARMALASLALREDRERLDWLDRQNVQVRAPLRYGSRATFYATVGEDEETCGIRTAIDSARGAHK